MSFCSLNCAKAYYLHHYGKTSKPFKALDYFARWAWGTSLEGVVPSAGRCVLQEYGGNVRGALEFRQESLASHRSKHQTRVPRDMSSGVAFASAETTSSEEVSWFSPTPSLQRIDLSRFSNLSPQTLIHQLDLSHFPPSATAEKKALVRIPPSPPRGVGPSSSNQALHCVARPSVSVSDPQIKSFSEVRRLSVPLAQLGEHVPHPHASSRSAHERTSHTSVSRHGPRASGTLRDLFSSVVQTSLEVDGRFDAKAPSASSVDTKNHPPSSPSGGEEKIAVVDSSFPETLGRPQDADAITFHDHSTSQVTRHGSDIEEGPYTSRSREEEEGDNQPTETEANKRAEKGRGRGRGRGTKRKQEKERTEKEYQKEKKKKEKEKEKETDNHPSLQTTFRRRFGNS